MAIEEDLEKLLDSEKLANWVTKWKEADVREPYLKIAELAHQRLNQLLKIWLDERRIIAPEEFDKELLSPVILNIEGEKARAWKYLMEGKEVEGISIDDIVSGNPAWAVEMPIFTSEKPSRKSEETITIYDLPPQTRQEIAIRLLETLRDENKSIGDKYKEVFSFTKEEILKAGQGKNWKGGIGVSLLTAIAHALEPDKYIHLDKFFARAIVKVGGEETGLNTYNLFERLETLNVFAKEYEKICTFAKKLKEKFNLGNLCDVYWFFKWIDEKIKDDELKLEDLKKRPCFFSICKNKTEREGIEKGVFARVKRFLEKWRDVKKGDIGFCLNTDSDTLLGIFVAESEAWLNLVPDCSFNAEYPAQIKVKLLGELQRIENASEKLKAIGIDPQEIRYKPPQKEKLYYPPEVTEKVLSLFQIPILEELKRGLQEYFRSKGFQFTDEQVFSFYNALKTKGFVILAGLSGTGKTKIAQLFAELVAEDKDKQLCFLSVRPEWRDTTYLLGYYNPITEKYQSTPLLKFILNAVEDVNKPYFLILDEMNLAHIEYYFADFLSVLESGREDDGYTKEAIKLHSSIDVKDESDKDIPPEVKLPPNLYLIGTVNIDETTYMFSPKVLDRAFTLEFREVDLDNYPPKPIEKEGNWAKLRNDIAEDLVNGGRYYGYGKDDVKKALEALGNFKDGLKSLNDVLLPYNLGFAYRVVDEIALFLLNCRKKKEFLPDISEEKAKDIAIMMKVLPKFHGPRGKVEVPLLEVLKWSLKDTVKQRVEGKTIWEEIYDTLFKDEEIREEDKTPRKIIHQWQKHSEKFKYPFTAKKVLEMLARLYETGFTSFM